MVVGDGLSYLCWTCASLSSAGTRSSLGTRWALRIEGGKAIFKLLLEGCEAWSSKLGAVLEDVDEVLSSSNTVRDMGNGSVFPKNVGEVFLTNKIDEPIKRWSTGPFSENADVLRVEVGFGWFTSSSWRSSLWKDSFSYTSSSFVGCSSSFSSSSSTFFDGCWFSYSFLSGWMWNSLLWCRFELFSRCLKFCSEASIISESLLNSFLLSTCLSLWEF